ncbi:hypothetical protein JKP88DRAFT_337448 [Tribonema minus]|uniref:Uncharacterized protein n=1 Tax=Tribonema minus TaxID=303371 RepID=A0A836C7C3_9STRA|nr:hypothetical protein JKP88DRAFT_337448 [Tribonema minus]
MAASARAPILITGASQGIGLAICQGIISKPEGFHVLMGCRDVDKGKKAMEELKEGPGSAEVIRLDVTNADHIAAVAETIRTRFSGQLSAVVNNAGVGLDLPFQSATPTPETCQTTLAINYHGAVAVTAAMLPFLKAGGRVVNISSGAGAQNMDKTSEARRLELLREDLTEAEVARVARFNVTRRILSDSRVPPCASVADLTEADVAAHVARFEAAYAREVQLDLTEAEVAAHVARFEAAYAREAAAGAPLPALVDGYWLQCVLCGAAAQAYGFSKAAMNAWTRALARRRPDLAVNACSPGFVRTAMTAEYDATVELRTLRSAAAAHRTPEEGADTPVWLACDDLRGATGKFFGNGRAERDWVNY